MTNSSYPSHSHWGNKPTIGVLTGWQFYHTATNLSYLEPVFRGISRAAKDFQCNLLLGCGIGSSASVTDPLRPAWPVAYTDADFVPIGPWNTDGLIIANPLHSPARSAYLREVKKDGHPVLFLGAGESGPAMVADNAGGIFKAMNHLVEHGHQQIAFIAGSLEDMEGDTGARLTAYQQAVEQYGLRNDSRLVRFGRHVYDGGYEAMQKIIASGTPFTAVLASNDESAMGAMQALREAGRNIPDEVAVIGFDNRPEGIVQAPSLTSIHVPLFDMGYHAVEQLLQHLGAGIPLPEETKVETRLILRESCGCDLHQGVTSVEQATTRPQFIQAFSNTIFSQAHGLTEAECQSFSQRLVETFAGSVQSGDQAGFLSGLTEILDVTAQKGDDNQIWQNALSFFRRGVAKGLLPDRPGLLNELINEARLVISTYIQKQHRQAIINDRWASTQLRRLTAELLGALDETQIYEALKKHLPGMGVDTALLAFLTGQGDARFAQCTLRNGLQPKWIKAEFPTQAFPPRGLFGEEKPFHLAIIPMLDQATQIGFVAFNADRLELYGSIVQQLVSALKMVTLYRQANEGRQLAEEANQMKSRFLSTISHELRTPLNLVVGLSGMMVQASEEDGLELPASAQKDIERIHAYAQYLGGLIGDVLDLATSDAGRLKLNLEPLDLSQTLRMVATSGSQLAEDKGLRWKADLPESGPWVMGDRTRLRQIALNLINNAIKFTEEGGVSLTLEMGTGEATVFVRDTGMGISPDEQAVIFDEFYRSDRSIERGFSGLGLGLAICKRLVEMHGGQIGVRDSQENGGGATGSGATFYFSLPTVAAPVQEDVRGTHPAQVGSGVLVLTNLLEKMLPFKQRLKQGNTTVRVLPMTHHPAWRAEIQHNPPDLIVLDVSADPEAGWATLSALKSHPATRSIPVMFYKSTREGEAILKLDYLTKPIDQDELETALDWLTSAGPTETRNFLVVEDDLSTLEMHARIVQSVSPSNRVFMARDGREGLKILEQHAIDLILLDLQMPGMDGFAMLEAMRAVNTLRDIPVIVITGKTINEVEMKRLNQGVAVVLGKGLFSPEETVDHMVAALDRKKKLSREAQGLVRAAMVYLHEHYAEPLTREAVANHVGITQDYLTLCFRQELGTTPIKYLRRYRVNKAKELLVTTGKTITEIAVEVGFSDSGYFSRVFRQETGMSPEAFRQG